MQVKFPNLCQDLKLFAHNHTEVDDDFLLYYHLMENTDIEIIWKMKHGDVNISIAYSDIHSGEHRPPHDVVNYEDLCEDKTQFTCSLVEGWTSDSSRTWFGPAGVDEEEGTEGLTTKTTPAQARRIDDNMAINESMDKIMFMGAKKNRGVLLAWSYPLNVIFGSCLERITVADMPTFNPSILLLHPAP